MAKKKRSAAKSDDLQEMTIEPPLDRRAMEQMMRQMLGKLGGEQPGDSPLDRAQELMYQAFAASATEQVRLAKRALKISPDCADAYVLLAEYAGTVEEALTLYKQGVEAGERALGKKAFKEDVGYFWGLLETRPYMRARQSLAQCLWEAGRREDAADHYWEMLRLNPNDNQGVRYSLATLLLDLERDDELRKLLSQYDDDAGAEWVYTKTLLAFRDGGESVEAGRLLKQAVKANKHISAYLLGNKQLPRELPPYITIGGEDEAISYAVGNRRAWMNTPGAISWIRKTLRIPLPKPSKPRRPSWPQLKLALLGCPQERGEVWQVDTMPLLENQAAPDEESPWIIVAIGRTSLEVQCLEVCEAKPKANDVWDYVVDTMRKPRQSDPHRPSRIEVRQKEFQTAWKVKLKQIGVECVLVETLDSVDQVRHNLPPMDDDTDVNEQNTTSCAEDALAFPIEPGEVWQVDLRCMPIWIAGEGKPYRPWMGLVVSPTDDLVLAHLPVPERPPAEWLWNVIFQAIRQPAIGEPHRPGAIEVSSDEHCEALRPLLERAGIECSVLEELEGINSAIGNLMQHMGAGGPPSIVDSPGMKPMQVGSFYAAAADYYRRKPWQQVPGDTIIRVQCDTFQSGPWYAVVMGQSGVQQGLAVYEDLAALQALMVGDASDEEGARAMSALSMMFSEPFEISTRDLDATEKYGWPVAGPEAYPMVLRVNPGAAIRAPLVWEIELLEGCLRTIPDFLGERNGSFSKTVTVASGALTLHLSWVSE